MNSRLWMLFPLLMAAVPVQALDLKGYLEEVTQKHRGLESLRISKESAEDTRVAGDMELNPVLTLKGGYLSDKKQPSQVTAQETRAETYSLNLGKKFSTGTSLGLSANANGYEYVNLQNPLFAQMLGGTQYAQGGLGVSLSQSLWRDAFGRGTRLRREREAATATAQGGSYDLQARQILTEAEAAFWDYLYYKREVDVRTASLARAERIQNWISRRVSDGISDRADLLNAQALVSSRKLQLVMAEDEIVAAEKKLRDYLELPTEQALPSLEGQIGSRRNLKQLLGDDNGRVMRLDAWLSAQESKAKEAGAREAEDKVSADLTLSGSYNTNSYAPGGNARDATKDWAKTNTPTAAVGVTWTYLFDTDVKSSVVGAARKQAMAARLQAERKSRESDTAWSELNRRYEELGRKISRSEEISKIQTERAKAQQNKLSRGRAITLDVINSEQDAAEAELQWARLQVEQRKLEAQSRLFVVVKE